MPEVGEDMAVPSDEPAECEDSTNLSPAATHTHTQTHTDTSQGWLEHKHFNATTYHAHDAT